MLARDAKPDEMAVLLSTLSRFEARFTQDPHAARSVLAAGESKIDARFYPAQLAAYATLANLILNLDEAVTKQ